MFKLKNSLLIAEGQEYEALIRGALGTILKAFLKTNNVEESLRSLLYTGGVLMKYFQEACQKLLGLLEDDK